RRQIGGQATRRVRDGEQVESFGRVPNEDDRPPVGRHIRPYRAACRCGQLARRTSGFVKTELVEVERAITKLTRGHDRPPVRSPMNGTSTSSRDPRPSRTHTSIRPSGDRSGSFNRASRVSWRTCPPRLSYAKRSL